jgi:hypothetical protein
MFPEAFPPSFSISNKFAPISSSLAAAITPIQQANNNQTTTNMQS